MLAITCGFSACKASASKAQAENDSIQTEKSTLFVTDSVMYHQGNDSTLTCAITVDYPTESDSFSLAVRHYLNQELGNLFLPVVNEEPDPAKKQRYKGDLANGQTVVDFYGKGNMKYLREQQQEIGTYDDGNTPAMSYEAGIRKTAETDSYVTYRSTSYVFLGGAHGSASDYSVNICKDSKKVLKESVDTTKVKALQPLLKKGVLSYLKQAGEEEVNEQNLGDYLFIDKGIIPMPAHTPALTDKGVHFIYQQYEIGPYAMGMVEFTIPYQDIKPYLTAEAAKLLK